MLQGDQLSYYSDVTQFRLSSQLIGTIGREEERKKARKKERKRKRERERERERAREREREREREKGKSCNQDLIFS